MKVTRAEFVKSAMRPEDYPKDRRPEIAFAGRSNVGKSSLLNVLLNRKGLAKTSKTPGKTQTINFFDVNGKLYFVDLPGYGYAKVSLKVRDRWRKIVTDYLRERETLRVVCHLIDIRHEPASADHELLDLLDEAEVPTLLIATKSDKIGRTQLGKAVKRLRESLELDEDMLVVPVSSVTKAGLDELWEVIDDLST